MMKQKPILLSLALVTFVCTLFIGFFTGLYVGILGGRRSATNAFEQETSLWAMEAYWAVVCEYAPSALGVSDSQPTTYNYIEDNLFEIADGEGSALFYASTLRSSLSSIPYGISVSLTKNMTDGKIWSEEAQVFE